MDKHEREDNVCRAVIQVLQERLGAEAKQFSRPEDEDRHKAKQVELIFLLGEIRYVIEHTLVESFAEEIFDAQRQRDLLHPIIEKLAGLLPSPGSYTFCVLSFPKSQITDESQDSDAVITPKCRNAA